MKLYTRNQKGNRVRVSLAEALTRAIEAAGLKTDNVDWRNEDCYVVGIVQENKNSDQVTVNIEFDGTMDKVAGVKVYTDPIKRMVVPDQTKVIV
jgi:surface antigen